jgi:hypothetical protein
MPYDPYVRLQSVLRLHGGAGLSLPVAAQAVEQLRVALKVASNPIVAT